MHPKSSSGGRPGPRRARAIGAAWLAALVIVIIGGVAEAAPAGVFVWTSGPVDALSRDGTTRAIVRGDPLLEGDTVRTGTGGLAQVRLADGGILSIRSDTQWRLDRFRYADARGGSAMVIDLVRGGLRSVTGMIGRVSPEAYLIVTPTAWIGVRGTDHEPFVVPEGDARHPAGTYDRVHEGRIVMRANMAGNPGDEVELTAGQTAFVGSGAGAPVLLDAVPPFYIPPTSLPPPGRAAVSDALVPANDQTTRSAAVKPQAPRATPGIPPAPGPAVPAAPMASPDVPRVRPAGPERPDLAFPEAPRFDSPPVR